MSVNFNPIYGGYSTSVGLNGDVKMSTTSKSTSPLQDKTAGIDRAMSIQGIANRPIVVQSDEVTFNDDGTIVERKILSTYQGATLKSNSTPETLLSAPEGVSCGEQKMHFVDKSFEKSENIKNCVFLMKNEDGSMTKYSMAPDKNMPNKIIVSAKNAGEKDFKPIDDFKFDSSSTDTDRLMHAAVHTYIDIKGAENLYQFAVGKIS